MPPLPLRVQAAGTSPPPRRLVPAAFRRGWRSERGGRRRRARGPAGAPGGGRRRGQAARGNIGLGPKQGPSAGHVRDPIAFWDHYYRTHDESPGELIEKVTELRKAKQSKDVEAALRGYLTHRIKRAESWMYQMLAVAVAERNGDPKEVRLYLGYGAFKALQSGLPDQLLNVADLLMRHGIYDKVGPPGKETSAGELIDLVAKKVVHRPEPLMMSVNLAMKTKDPKRMGDAAEAMLSLGWPNPGTGQVNVDETLRRELRTQVEALAKLLREEGRSPEADALLARLNAAWGRDVYVRLSWEGKDDLDLLVDEPLGVTCQLFKTPRTIFGGSILVNGYGTHPEEVYVCPRGFDGTYTVRVEPIYQPTDTAAKVAQVEIVTNEGTPQEKRIVQTIDLAKPAPVSFKLVGGRRKEVLPMMAAPPKPPVLVPDDPNKPAPEPCPGRARPASRPAG